MVYIIRRPNAAHQLETDQRETWKDEALCAETDPDLFFPKLKDDYAAPRKVCNKCTVRDECFRSIMKSEGKKKLASRHGMVAGLTPAQRLHRSRLYTSQELQAL